MSKSPDTNGAALRGQAATPGLKALILLAGRQGFEDSARCGAAIATAALRREPVDQSLVPPRRLARLRDCLEMLEEALGDTPLVEQLSIELTGLNDELETGTEVNAVA